MNDSNWLAGIRARCNGYRRVCPFDIELNDRDREDWYAGWDFAHAIIDVGEIVHAHSN